MISLLWNPIHKIVEELKGLHSRALKPTLDSDTARDEQEIEIQTKDITKVRRIVIVGEIIRNMYERMALMSFLNTQHSNALDVLCLPRSYRVNQDKGIYIYIYLTNFF